MDPRTSEDSVLSPPIPSYDEATSASNPLLGSANSFLDSSRKYKPPHVRSARGSEDSLYDPDLDDNITELESQPDTDDDIDDLDYQGIELDDLGNGARRPRRRGNKSGWKERFSDLRRRVGSWRLWQLNVNLPNVPESWKNSSAVVARLFGLLTLIILGYAFFAFAIFPASQNELAAMFDLESVRQFAQSSVDNGQINKYLEHVTRFNHVAGTTGSYYLAEWMKDLFIDAGLDEVDIEEYQVYLNYPTKDGRRVAITAPEELKFEAKLDEPQAYPDETLVGRANSFPFHGLSRSGTVSGPLMYFNYGSEQDYELACSSWAVNCTGAVAIVRYYGTQQDIAMKVKNAEKWGIKGVLLYSDPADDGLMKGPIWPEGRWRPAHSVQSGTVALKNWIVGDVLTPGWSSTNDANRANKDKNPGLVNIPSLPLSFADAQPLLKAVDGHGRQVPDSWRGGMADVEWYSGDQNSPTVLLQNEQEERDKERIFNVMGKITGAEADGKTIIVGNHRDSWCFGAADPGSGTAVMLEVIRIIGLLKEQGWRPLRSIIFASWDAKEYNMIGSTEFVEDRIDSIRKSGVAYLNVGAGVSGPDFHASASPLFHRALSRVIDRVSDPINNQTLREIWDSKDSKLGSLGSDGDYVPFQDLAGTSSIDFGFSGDRYPSHSCYETYEWMTTIGDPGLQYHTVLAQVFVLLLLEVSQDFLLPFGMFDYVDALSHQLGLLKHRASDLGATTTVDFTLMDGSIADLRKAAALREDWEVWWFGQVYGTGALETNALAELRRKHNNRISDFETDLLDLPGADEDHPKGQLYGLPGREQFKHVVFGPSIGDGYEANWFPFIRDAVEAKDWDKAKEMIRKTAQIISRAASFVGVPD